MQKVTSLLLATLSLFLANPEIAHAMEGQGYSLTYKQSLELRLESNPSLSHSRKTPQDRFASMANDLTQKGEPEERIAYLQESEKNPETLKKWRDGAVGLKGMELLESIQTSRNILGYYPEYIGYHTRNVTTPELEKATSQFLLKVFGFHLDQIQSRNFKDKYEGTLNRCVFKAIEDHSLYFLHHHTKNHSDFKAYKTFIFNSFKIIPVEMVHDVMTYFLKIVQQSTTNLNQAHKRTKHIFKDLSQSKFGSDFSYSRRELSKHSSQYWQQMLDIFMKLEDIPENERLSKAIPFLMKSKEFSKGKSVKFLQDYLMKLK